MSIFESELKYFYCLSTVNMPLNKVDCLAPTVRTSTLANISYRPACHEFQRVPLVRYFLSHYRLSRLSIKPDRYGPNCIFSALLDRYVSIPNCLLVRTINLAMKLSCRLSNLLRPFCIYVLLSFVPIMKDIPWCNSI